MTFAALKDMARVVHEYKSEQPEVLGNVSTALLEDAHRLYQILLEKQHATEDEIINTFFQADTPDYQYYECVKTKLEKVIINSSYLIDQSKIDNSRVATYISSLCYLTAGEVMFQLGEHTASSGAIETAFEASLKHEFTRLCADALYFLKTYYYSHQSDAQKLAYYNALHKEFEGKRNMEVQAKIYHDDLIQYYNSSKIPNQAVSQKAREYHQALQSENLDKQSNGYKLMTHTIGIIQYMTANQYLQALNLCETAIKEYAHNNNINRGPIALFFAQKVFCLIHLKMHNNLAIEEALKTYFRLSTKNGYNAFKGHELALFYTLHTRQYPKALQHYEKGRNHPLFPNLTGILRENWLLYGGYLHLLAELGQLDKKAVEKTVGPFRYSKFINDIKILSKEKEGMNIPLMNLPILFSLARGEGDFPEEYMATLERYRKRYLRDEMNIRSASFVKLLLLLARKPFEGKNVDRKIEKELAILRQQQPQFSRQTIAIEIIPYEDLWWLLTGTPV